MKLRHKAKDEKLGNASVESRTGKSASIRNIKGSTCERQFCSPVAAIPSADFGLPLPTRKIAPRSIIRPLES